VAVLACFRLKSIRSERKPLTSRIGASIFWLVYSVHYFSGVLQGTLPGGLRRRKSGAGALLPARNIPR
jgi:uncharacterized membrane protein